MPHGWKYLMDTATDSRTYRIARVHYLDKYEEYDAWYSHRVWDTGCRKLDIRVPGRKKRKWLKPRTYDSLSVPIKTGTEVLVKVPFEFYPSSFPTSIGDFSDIDIVGVVRGYIPPREIHRPYHCGACKGKDLSGVRTFSRKRRYLVEIIIGRNKGCTFNYPEQMIRVPSPSELRIALFIMRIREMSGEL